MANRRGLAARVVLLLGALTALAPACARRPAEGSTRRGDAPPGSTTPAARRPLRIAYSDWPGWTAFDIGMKKGWFKEAGVEVELVWLDYLLSLDAFSAGKVDAVMVTNGDALVTGANGAKSKIILVTDYSNGNDQIIARPGLRSFADLKGKKIGLELTLVEHLLLLKALERFKMKPSDVELVNFPTIDTPQALASSEVSAIAVWYPIAGRARRAVPGARAVFTSADIPGLIYDTVAVNPASLAERKDDWKAVVRVWHRISDFVRDPRTQPEAAAIMAARAGVEPAEYAANIQGTRFLSVEEAKRCLRKGEGLDSIYGSSETADAFNVTNKVYKSSQSVEEYIYPDFVLAL